MTESIVTVTVAASSYDLVTLADVKTELNISDSSQDATLSRYISSASAAAAQYCNRVFPVETVSEYFSPRSRRDNRFLNLGLEPLQLARWPLTAITSVTEEDTALVAGTDYLESATRGQLIRIDDDAFPKAWLNQPITVVYSAGYATIPYDVQDAVIRMITKRYSDKGRDMSLKQESIPGVIERSWWVSSAKDASSSNMTPDISDLLDNYRVPIA